MLCLSIIYESIKPFCQTQHVSSFLILSMFRAVRWFYIAYSNIVFAHPWGYKQRQKTQGQIPENEDDVLFAFKL